ncbi:unnamed protein product [Dicrocoelium dendriticum]|nr:unnamed protein product [Dicrocoelium dendriticum]
MESVSLCEICSENSHKYKCPRCGCKTCSLTCCTEHKVKFNCSGVRDAVVYCQRSEYGVFHFQQDYRLLEEIDRRNAFREKELAQLNCKNRWQLRCRKELIKAAEGSGIRLRLNPTPVLSRARINRSRVVTGPDSRKIIRWSVEFCLLPFSSSGDTYCLKGFHLSRTKPIRLVLHDCEEDTRLMTIWNGLMERTNEEQDALITFKPPGSPPFGLVASWLHARVRKCDEPRYYFYIQASSCDVNKANEKLEGNIRLAPTELLPSNLLSQILIIPGVTIHEIPTIWVSRVELTR